MTEPSAELPSFSYDKDNLYMGRIVIEGKNFSFPSSNEEMVEAIRLALEEQEVGKDERLEDKGDKGVKEKRNEETEENEGKKTKEKRKTKKRRDGSITWTDLFSREIVR